MLRVTRVLDYNFTTAEQSTDQLMENSGIFGNMMEAINRTTRYQPEFVEIFFLLYVVYI